MKHILLKKILPVLVLMGVLSWPGCNDKWDDHYETSTIELPGSTIFEFIESRAELSIFSQMLKLTGYDKIIGASQTFTVWVPDNTALEGVDLNDLVLVKEIVENHITRGLHTTSGVSIKAVNMYNGKYVPFMREFSGFSFGRKVLSTPNVKLKNGIVHIINGYVPYTNNILEHIERAANFDSLRKYFQSQNRVIFDPVNSTEVGYNENGQPIYDSVFVHRNLALMRLGSLGVEDSIYTAILPNNTAWIEAYDRIKNYYNIPNVFGGAQRRHAEVQRTIVQDMVFRGVISEPTAFDSLVSTNRNRNVFYNPARLFEGSTKTELSNGLVYETSQMQFVDTTSWFKEIRIEAENTNRRTNANSIISLRTSYGSGLAVSNDRYITVEPTGTSDIAMPAVTFAIPNTLSATYNVYCVFVPASIADPTNLRPNKANFRLVRISTTAGRTSGTNITPANNVTDSNNLTRMFVGKFKFDFAEVVDQEYPNVLTTLTVTNAVRQNEIANFSRTMRIDCIILEPVSE